jgi:hypothetical protein
MRETVSVKPDEIQHDVQNTRAKLTELCNGLALPAHEEVAQALADLAADLDRIEAEVFRAQPSSGLNDVLRLDVAEIRDALPRSEPALERRLQGIVTNVTYIERRLKILDAERAAVLRRRALRRAGVQALLGLFVAMAPFVLGYARTRPLIASTQVLAGSVTAASALLVGTPAVRS